jgi:hypothetical protein
MGALRAAELSVYGMRGVGRVFEAYRDGRWPGFDDVLEDDDEVAVTHAPPELGAMPLSDAMVDLRDTLLAAEAAGVLTRADRDALCAALKALPFPDRDFSTLAARAGPALRAWLPAGKIARKRLDAEAMLSALATFLAEDPPPFVPAFRFEHVQVWEDFVRAEAVAPGAEAALVLEELRLRPDDWQEAARAVLGRLHAGAAPPSAAATRRAFDAFRTPRNLVRRVDVDAWLADNAVSPAGFARLLRDEAALAAAVAAAPPGLAAGLADHLRLTGQFAPLLRRARAKQAALAAAPPPPAGPELDAALAWFAERHRITLSVLRNDDALAAVVWREYEFLRRVR